MKLSFLLGEECILTGLDATERPRKAILAELLDALYERTSLKDEGVSKESLLNDLITREWEMGTGLGEGLAFPHTRLETVSRSYTLLGICPEGTEFRSLDQKPVHFSCSRSFRWIRPASCCSTAPSSSGSSRLRRTAGPFSRLSLLVLHDDLLRSHFARF